MKSFPTPTIDWENLSSFFGKGWIRCFSLLNYVECEGICFWNPESAVCCFLLDSPKRNILSYLFLIYVIGNQLWSYQPFPATNCIWMVVIFYIESLYVLCVNLICIMQMVVLVSTSRFHDHVVDKIKIHRH